MAILMLCNIPIYDISNDRILDEKRCPFVININNSTKQAYETWYSHRQYLKTNRNAERIVSQTGGEETCEAKRRLSLSDCFWIKYPYDNNNFYEITPYIVPFSLMAVNSSSVPELVLGGSQPKEWGKGRDNTTYMIKMESNKQIHAEMLAVKLALESGIKSMNAFVRTDKGRLYAKAYSKDIDYSYLGQINLVNFTNTSRSLIQFDQLGIGINGYNIKNIAKAYKKAGVNLQSLSVPMSQILFDCTIGNIDRKTNNSNWGIFLNNETGERSPSWMYDFNWANLYTRNDDMLKEVVVSIKDLSLENESYNFLNHLKYKCNNLGLKLWEENIQIILDTISKTSFSFTASQVFTK